MKKSLLLLVAICLVSFGSVYGQASCTYSLGGLHTGTLTFDVQSQSGTPCDAHILVTASNVFNFTGAGISSPSTNSAYFTLSNSSCTGTCDNTPAANGSVTWEIDGSSGISCNSVAINMTNAIGGTCKNQTFLISTNDFGTLPVELTSFEAKKEASVTVLNWQTATEENNEKFEIEVSQDGKHFTKIGEVEGHGTTQEVQNYEFIDAQPKAGINYYRLTQVDFNGVYDFSDVVSVEFEDLSEPVSIFPNPVKSQLNIINGAGQATVYNILGQPVKEFAVGSEQFAVNTDDLASGQYVLRIIQNGGTVVTKQFTK